MVEMPHRPDTPTGREQRPADRAEKTAPDETAVGHPVFVVRSVGELEGQSFEIRPGTHVIGRHPDCELCIDDGFVSRRHAIVVSDRNAVLIEDAGSANGTSVNGERLLEGRRSLRSGDVVRIGKIDLVYLDGLETPTRRLDLLQPLQEAPPVEVLSRSATDDTPVQQRPATSAPARERKAGDARALAPRRVALDTAAASVAALLLAARQQDQMRAAIAAALFSLVTAFVQTPGARQLHRVAGAAVLAFALAAVGITLPELALNRSLLDPNRPTTLAPPSLDPRPKPGIHVHPNPVVCQATPVDQSAQCPVTIESTGSARLLVTSITLVGPAADEFTFDDSACRRRSLAPSEHCSIELTFQPTRVGPGSATLVVHQNLPKPDTGTLVFLTGQGIGEQTTTTVS